MDTVSNIYDFENVKYLCRTEADGEKLWLPDDSVYTERKRWKSAYLDERTRGHVTMLGHPENVLTPEALLKVRGGNIYFRSEDFHPSNVNYSDCEGG